MQSERRCRILYIEDDRDTRELFSFVLNNHGIEVVIAENYDQGLLQAQSQEFDLYLIDNWLVGHSGLELCRALRQFDEQTPILFFSGAALPKHAEEALAAGAQGYLVKPADTRTVVREVLRHILEAKRTTGQA